MRKTTYTESAHTADTTQPLADASQPTNGLPNRLTTAFEVAEFIGCHKETVRRAYLRGLLVSQRFGVRGRRDYVAADECESWLLRSLRSHSRKERNDDDHDPHDGVYCADRHTFDQIAAGVRTRERAWKIGFTTGMGQRPRIRQIAAGAVDRVLDEIARAKSRLKLATDTPVVTCYEAGRDGFWLHRWLVAQGLTNHVVDSSSIEVNRRARRAKTDRLDVTGLLNLLARYFLGDHRVWRVVRVPTVAEEDARQLHRTWESVQQDRSRLLCRLQGLRARPGVDPALHFVRLGESPAPSISPIGRESRSDDRVRTRHHGDLQTGRPVHHCDTSDSRDWRVACRAIETLTETLTVGPGGIQQTRADANHWKY